MSGKLKKRVVVKKPGKKPIKNRDLGQVVQSVVSSLGELKPWMTSVENRLRVLGQNQVELSSSQHNTDNQMAVQIRMDIMQHNAIREALRQLMVKVAPDLIPTLPDPITVQAINKMFEDWDRFKARPDHKKLFSEWYLGHNLDDLPPVPSAPEASDDNPEGAGEEHATTTERNPVSQAQDSQEDQTGPSTVPEVPGPDGPENQSPDGQGV